MLDSVTVEVYTTEEVKNAAAQSYLTARRGSMGTISRRRSSMDEEESIAKEDRPSNKRLMQIIGNSGLNDSDKQLLEGKVKSREDVISSAARRGESEAVTRKTSLVKIDLQSCGSEYCT